MADEFDRAQEHEERERQILLQEQLRRGAPTPGDDCRECDEPLEDHRKKYGICVHCKTVQETNEKHHRRN